jgi:hypothetical protein
MSNEFLFTILAIVLVMSALCILLAANAKPKGRDLEFLTSSVPGESILDTRVANACLADAEPNALSELIMMATDAGVGTDATIGLIRKMSGGLWVGGRVFITSHRVVFIPNGMNRALHKALPVIAFRLSDITEANMRFGMVTKIADVSTKTGTLTIRAFDMNGFVMKLNAARAGA